MVPATGEKRWQVMVPRDMQEAVLKAMHGTAGSGHFEVTKTLRCLRQAFYWGRLRHDLEDFCRRCDLCTARKVSLGPSYSSFRWGNQCRGWGLTLWGHFLAPRGKSICFDSYGLLYKMA